MQLIRGFERTATHPQSSMEYGSLVDIFGVDTNWPFDLPFFSCFHWHASGFQKQWGHLQASFSAKGGTLMNARIRYFCDGPDGSYCL